MAFSDTVGLRLHFGQSARFVSVGPAGAAPHFTAIDAFGDSLSDAGNDYILSSGAFPVSPPYDDGRFSNGAVWVQDLASYLHVTIPQPSLAGGTDYAYGGAETGGTPLHAANGLDLPAQLAAFETHAGTVPAGALCTLTIGANDVIAALPTFATNPAAAIADVSAAVGNEMRFIGALAAHGATNILVMNVPDLGLTPEEAADRPGASALASIYDADLHAAFKALTLQDHLNGYLLDAYTLIDQGAAYARAFGFSNVTDPLWTGNFSDPASGHLAASGAAAGGYLFFDHLHPTAQGHVILAEAASKLL